MLTDHFLRMLAARVHDAGGLIAIDGYHATGSTVIDVEKLQADIYFGGLLKEASGSSGNAYLYIRPGLDLAPRSSGWFADAQPFEFSQRPTDHPSIRRRFMSGTPAVASMYHAVEGLRLLLDVGLDRVREDSLLKTQRCIERVDEAGLQLASPREERRRGAMVILEVARADLLCAYLKTQRIFTDSRKQRFLRMAPFVWNTAADIDRTFTAIQDALSSQEYLDVDVGHTSGPVT